MKVVVTGATGFIGRHVVAELHERVLDVPRVLLVVEEFAELRVRKVSAEPRTPPEEERHQDNEPCGGEE